MIIKTGFVRYPFSTPIIYFIVSLDILYIGETQRQPFQRWNDHLSEGGSFTRNLQKLGDPELDYHHHLLFFSYFCEEITIQFPKIQWRLATQALEHRLHCMVHASPHKLPKRLKLISNTEKTAPRTFKQPQWEYIEPLADKTFTFFSNDLSSIE